MVRVVLLVNTNWKYRKAMMVVVTVKCLVIVHMSLRFSPLAVTIMHFVALLLRRSVGCDHSGQSLLESISQQF